MPGAMDWHKWDDEGVSIDYLLSFCLCNIGRQLLAKMLSKGAQQSNRVGEVPIGDCESPLSV